MAHMESLTPSSLDEIKASTQVLAFDIFGTVVDWHGSIMREMQALYPSVDGSAFALAWRAGYQPAMARVRSGELGWTRIDELHRLILDDLLLKFDLLHLNDSERVHLNRAWHRLEAWADSVAGLHRLKKKFTICSLSNGNLGLLTNMAKRAGLPWDCILSAEVFRAYKPDPATYLGVAATFDLQPHQVMLCAAHHDDLEAARACGLRTAYIERPFEFGASQPKDVSPQASNDLHARDIHALADLLGC
jgi:2-haloacid dehalogenase